MGLEEAKYASERTPLLKGTQNEEIKIIPCEYGTFYALPVSELIDLTDPAMDSLAAGFMKRTGESLVKAFTGDMMVIYSFVCSF